MIDIKKRTQVLFGILGLVVSLAFVFLSMGKSSVVLGMALVSSIFLGLFLWSEGALLSYLRKKEYRKIGIGDVIVWMSFAVGGILIVQAMILANFLTSGIPQSLANFISVNGVVIGILAFLLFIYHMFRPTPR